LVKAKHTDAVYNQLQHHWSVIPEGGKTLRSIFINVSQRYKKLGHPSAIIEAAF
jgi:hypothetical protein